MLKQGHGLRKGFGSVVTGLAVCALAWSAQAQEMPAGNGCVDVTSYNAKPNDALDDTKGFQDALKATIARGQWSHCYVPPGTYIVSNTIGTVGADSTLEWRFFTLRGAGPEKTVIRLKASSLGFNDVNLPKPVFYFRYWQNPNATHSLFVENLSIEIESGNAGAMALKFTSHNGGGVTNVTLRDIANTANIGLEMVDSPGPEYVKDVKVYGFSKGIHLNGGSYSATLENIYLEGQRLYGIHDLGVPLQIRKLTSKNTCRAISAGGAMLHVMDAVLQQGRAGNFGIVSQAPVYLRNVTSDGSVYTTLAVDAFTTPQTDLNGPIAEYVTPIVQKTYATSPSKSLGLEIKDVPSLPWDLPADWGDINALGGLQAAANSGKSTIYFPGSSSASGGEVHINKSSLKRIVGLGRDYPGKVVFDNTDPNSVVIVDQLRFGGGVEVKSAGKVVLKGFGSNITISGTGETYIEDYCCGTIYNNGAKVWARQINTETGGTTPTSDYRIKNNGGQLVLIGFKNEGSDGAVSNTAGGKADLLGGYLYPGDWFGVPVDPAFLNSESDIFISMNASAWTYPSFITETRNGTSQDVNPTFTGADIYVTNFAVSAQSQQSAARPVVAGARIQGSTLVATTSAGTSHTVRILDTRGRIVFERHGFGVQEYRMPALSGGVYAVRIETGTLKLAQTLAVRN